MIKIKSVLEKKKLFEYIESTKFSCDIKNSLKNTLERTIQGCEHDIVLDFDDLKIILDHGEEALYGTGEYKGENFIETAFKKAIADASLDEASIGKVAGILIHFIVHPDIQVMQLSAVMENIYANAHDEADILFGMTTDASISEDYAKVTVLLTGYEKVGYNAVANEIL